VLDRKYECTCVCHAGQVPCPKKSMCCQPPEEEVEGEGDDLATIDLTNVGIVEETSLDIEDGTWFTT